uniref:Uncharacterized protein n=1 Tax=Glossina pallidipes TaxID=7398 RepID=A0A1B0AED2_GLOPL
MVSKIYDHDNNEKNKENRPKHELEHIRTHTHKFMHQLCKIIPVSAVVSVVEVVRNFMKSCQTRQRSNRHTNSPNDVQSLYSLNLYAYAEENTVPVGVGAVNDDAATTAVVSVIISFDTYCVCCYCHGRKIAQ